MGGEGLVFGLEGGVGCWYGLVCGVECDTRAFRLNSRLLQESTSQSDDIKPPQSLRITVPYI